MPLASGFAVPPSLAHRLYALVTCLPGIPPPRLVRAVDCPGWARWWRLGSLVVVVVLVLRAAPLCLVR